jgi:hypothetical protein
MSLSQGIQYCISTDYRWLAKEQSGHPLLHSFSQETNPNESRLNEGGTIDVDLLS